ncbi:hypothetical protein JTE90_023386 [Oedothorax gibbosus]|uniref:Uncharacterized protein n=1 Tax=Oedothorax gibbosus TaxID=931172 RepID=A0AAV6UHK5_9ARAC|nr:hypothetical protein JTE90_023386 [Oedothorax gibbosus]
MGHIVDGRTEFKALHSFIKQITTIMSKEGMLPFLLFLFLGALGAQGGSPCPPDRSDLYPCACANVKGQGRRVATVVTCMGLRDSAALERVFNDVLRSMEIDQLHILDSFWNEEGGGSLPGDFLALGKMAAVEIADSRLATCFACPGKTSCRNSLTTRFSVSNSTSSERFCTSCDFTVSTKLQSFPGCMGGSLKEFRYSGGLLTSVSVDLFTVPMAALESLDLSRHRIVKVEPRALQFLTNLKSLDLSRNAIEHIDHVFAGQGLTKLQHLDLSYNLIGVIGNDFFPSLPSLKRLLIGNNVLRDMQERDWAKRPESLKNIDLRGNPLHCDCTVRWINSSFPVGSEVRGDCASPPDYALSPLRQASRQLTERCTRDGVLGTRPPALRRLRKKTTKRS